MKTQKDLMYEINMKKQFLKDRFGFDRFPRMKDVSLQKENEVLQAIIDFEHDCVIKDDTGSKIIIQFV